MPTYDYRCNACDHEFEHFQSITAPVMRKCPQCGRLKLERLIGTGAGVIFKGGGFYETDYRSESYRKAAEAEKSASGSGTERSSDKAADPKSESQANSKTDSKTETKAATKSDPGASTDGESRSSSTGTASGKAESKPSKAGRPGSKRGRSK